MKQLKHTLMAMATVAAVAIVVCSCKKKMIVAESLDLNKTPLQVVENIDFIQTDKGNVRTRVVTPIMEKYGTDTLDYEVFPKGIEVYAYTDNGILESIIFADNAYHEHRKGAKSDEIWKVFGNVVIKNLVKSETMETDTLYWDKMNREIYTDSYIRMYSRDGFIQGYGMRSDERARNAVVVNPFNSYTVVIRDTAHIVIDSVNFIGPLMEK